MISDANLPIFISATAFLVICLIFLGGFQYARDRARKRQLVERIDPDAEPWMLSPEENISALTGTGKAVHPILKFFGSLGNRVFPEKTPDYSLRTLKFLKAGLRGANTGAIFWGFKCFLAVCFGGLFLAVRLGLLKVMPSTTSLFLFVFMTIVGFYLPDVWLAMKTSKRKKKMQEGLPDALDLLVVCVEAGMGLDSAIHKVAEELQLSNTVLSDELKLLNLEIRAGKSRSDALRHLALRTGLEEINSLTTLLIQTDKFGTSVSQALRTYSDSFRTARYQKAEEAAAKLPIKLIFPLLFFIFPSFFVVALGPAMIQVYRMFMQK